jgi:hypothetical protein
MSKSTQSVIDRAFALGAYYEAKGLVDQADAWYALAYSLAELVG